MEEMEILDFKFLGARKEVKNLNYVRNLVSSFEDRHLGLVDFAEEGHTPQIKLVVLKKWPGGVLKPPLSSQGSLAGVASSLIEKTKTTLNIQTPLHQSTASAPPLDVENPYA